MESTRQQKIARLIQKDLGILFQQVSRDKFSGAIITVTKVYVTKDLSVAKVYLSLFATKDKEALMERIQHHVREMRHLLAQRTRHQLRVVPKLHFLGDDSLDYIDNIDNLLQDDPS
ncbi:MAG: 30S ribosome-binding factor RbfA [Bacteroidia bacterium]|nr:30S ribosome-binding factor RbfA [Bacteroidia bacterium]